MINDYEKAQQAIERHAVTQDHATRRAMKEIARWSNGVRLNTDNERFSDSVHFSIPVNIDGSDVGYARIDIYAEEDDEAPRVKAYFEPKGETVASRS